MSGRESAAVERALRLVVQGANISRAARACGIAVSTLRRALRRRGVPPLLGGRPTVHRQDEDDR